MSKLNKKQRLDIYNQWKSEGKTISSIARSENMNLGSLSYMIKLIDRYGIAIYDRPNEVFTKEFKEEAIEQALTGTKSIKDVSLELGLRSNGILFNWIREYKKNGYNVVIKKKGRHSAHESEKASPDIAQGFREADPATRRRKFEIAYRQRLRKKTKRLGSETSQEIAQAVTELRREFKVSLDYIFTVLAQNKDLPLIARSTYYNIIKPKDKKDKSKRKKPIFLFRLKEIFDYHQRRYGYRRVAMQLRKEGYTVTDRAVRYWMHKLKLKGRRRNKRKYSSYKGTIGKIAPNLIQRCFFAIRPNMKWYTDITEFHLNGQKLYLSPILDGCGGDIVSYSISRHPDMNLVMSMLNKAFAKHKALNACIFHTDQGCQYQSRVYQRALKLHGITQSMSRKGNSMDDGLMENFFGLLKTEMFYDQEYKYHNLEELAHAIEEYIEYYNNERIKSRLKGLTPIEYRNQALVS
ncbi:IS3 family transposase [uncultured Lactobacillus sp.]|uniref:IS3 family transposase n=1 Tax=uncultured Lactobacillus sp. TaxID=153152 RepID=UPI00272C048E|nr:IS3 family transposase [uncultured Lactobacillus sp.]